MALFFPLSVPAPVYPLLALVEPLQALLASDHGFLVGLPAPLEELPNVAHLLTKSAATLVHFRLPSRVSRHAARFHDGALSVSRFECLWPKYFVDGLTNTVARVISGGIDGGFDTAGLRMVFLCATKCLLAAALPNLSRKPHTPADFLFCKTQTTGGGHGQQLEFSSQITFCRPENPSDAPSSRDWASFQLHFARSKMHASLSASSDEAQLTTKSQPFAAIQRRLRKVPAANQLDFDTDGALVVRRVVPKPPSTPPPRQRAQHQRRPSVNSTPPRAPAGMPRPPHRMPKPPHHAPRPPSQSVDEQRQWMQKHQEEISTFMDAVCMGDVDCARNMLLGSATLVSVPDFDEGDFTALFFAASAGHADMCDLLLRFSADPNQVSKTDGSSPLCCAVANGHFSAAEALIQGKSDVNFQMFDYKSNVAEPHWQSVLFLATERCNGHIVNLLLTTNASVDVGDSAEETPLYSAVRRGDLDSVAALLHAKARTDIIPAGGTSLLAMAKDGGNSRVRKLLEKHAQQWGGGEVASQRRPPRDKAGDDTAAFHARSPELCSASEIKRILSTLSDVIRQSRRAGEASTYKQLRLRTCSVLRRQYGGRKWVSWFKRAAKRIVAASDKTDERSGSPASRASRSRSPAPSNRGGVPSTDDLDDKLIDASYDGLADAVEQALWMKADANVVDSEGYTPLMIASSLGHVQCVHALVRHDAVLDARDAVGATALMMAAQNAHKDITKLLLRCRADPGATLIDQNEGHPHEKAAGSELPAGSTALHLAAHQGHSDVLRVLVRYGANPNAKDIDGNTALDKAVAEGHEDAVGILMQVGRDGPQR